MTTYKKVPKFGGRVTSLEFFRYGKRVYPIASSGNIYEFDNGDLVKVSVA